MAALTIQSVASTGLAETLVSAGAGGDTIADDGLERTFMEVVNGSGASINVTLTAIQTAKRVAGVGSIAVANKVVAVPAGASRLIGPFTRAFRDSNGNVNVSYSAVTTVTVRALRLPTEG